VDGKLKSGCDAIQTDLRHGRKIRSISNLSSDGSLFLTLFRHDIAVPGGKHSNCPSFSNCFSHPIILYLPSTSASILFAAVYGWDLSGTRCLEAQYEYRAIRSWDTPPRRSSLGCVAGPQLMLQSCSRKHLIGPIAPIIPGLSSLGWCKGLL
jgi:hypothetical protein